MFRKLRTEITYIHYNHDMIHSRCMMKFVLGDMWIKQESRRQILVINVEYYYYDHLLQEQQMPLQVFSRGYFEFLGAIELVTHEDLYECFKQTSEEATDYLKRNKYFQPSEQFALPSKPLLSRQFKQFIADHST